jgi:hypothetical protein
MKQFVDEIELRAGRPLEPDQLATRRIGGLQLAGRSNRPRPGDRLLHSPVPRRQCRVIGLDITGEVAVFEALAARHVEAKAAGVMLLPGAGFDVVPSDCLAAHLKRRLPSATMLALGFSSLGRVSRGTATTIVENIHRGGLVRQDGVSCGRCLRPGRRE